MCVCPTVSSLAHQLTQKMSTDKGKKQVQSAWPSVTLSGVTISPTSAAHTQQNSIRTADNNNEEVSVPLPSTDCRWNHQFFGTSSFSFLQIAVCRAVTSLSTDSPSMTGWKRSTPLATPNLLYRRFVLDSGHLLKQEAPLGVLSRWILQISSAVFPSLSLSGTVCTEIVHCKTEQTVSFMEHRTSLNTAIHWKHFPGTTCLKLLTPIFELNGDSEQWWRFD